MEEEAVEKLEEEVIEMVKRVESYRSTLPQNLFSSLSSLLSLHRPAYSLLQQQPCTSRPDSTHNNCSTDLENDDSEQNPDEVNLLRDKISTNISAISEVLKRMNECISRIDQLVPYNETIDPLFKRNKG